MCVERVCVYEGRGGGRGGGKPRQQAEGAEATGRSEAEDGRGDKPECATDVASPSPSGCICNRLHTAQAGLPH
jgi:hypothetical protein